MSRRHTSQSMNLSVCSNRSCRFEFPNAWTDSTCKTRDFSIACFAMSMSDTRDCPQTPKCRCYCIRPFCLAGDEQKKRVSLDAKLQPCAHAKPIRIPGKIKPITASKSAACRLAFVACDASTSDALATTEERKESAVLLQTVPWQLAASIAMGCVCLWLDKCRPTTILLKNSGCAFVRIFAGHPPNRDVHLRDLLRAQPPSPSSSAVEQSAWQCLVPTTQLMPRSRTPLPLAATSKVHLFDRFPPHLQTTPITCLVLQVWSFALHDQGLQEVEHKTATMTGTSTTTLSAQPQTSMGLTWVRVFGCREP